MSIQPLVLSHRSGPMADALLAGLVVTARLIACALAAVLSAQSYLDVHGVIDRGTLDGPIHLAGAQVTLLTLYGFVAVFVVVTSVSLERGLSRLKRRQDVPAWLAIALPYVTWGVLTCVTMRAIGAWTVPDALAAVLLAADLVVGDVSRRRNR